MADISESDSNDSGFTDAQKALISQASQEFKDKKYDQCLSTMRKLQKQKDSDVKVICNKAVAEYCQNNFTRSEEFKKQIQDYTNVDLVCDADRVTLYFNFAVVAFYQRQFSQSLRAIEMISPYLKMMDDAFTRRSVLLHLEVLLRLQKKDRSIFDSAISSLSELGENPNFEADPLLPDTMNLERFKCEIYLLEVKSCLMSRSLNKANQEIKHLSTLTFNSNPILFVKAHFEYLKRNFKKSLNILNGVSRQILSVQECGECETVLHWNNLGCIHFAMGKHNLGAFYLKKALRENERISEEILQSVKSRSNGDKTSNLTPNESTAPFPPNLPLRSYSVSRHHEILMNLGVELLFSGKATQAFDYLLEVVNIYPKNPRLWLRLAECCIKAYRPNNDVDRQFNVRKRCVKKSVGTATVKKIALGTGVSDIKNPWEESAAMPTPTLEFGSLCVRNALLLLPWDPPAGDENTEEQKYHKQVAVLKWAEDQIFQLQPGGCLRGIDIIHLRSTILVCGAYITLSLNHFVETIELCKLLLAYPRLLSGAHQYLGRMYLAEALVNYNRLLDARSLLNVDSVTNIGLTFGPKPDVIDISEDDGDEANARENRHDDIPLVSWQPNSVNKARAIMMYNQAVICALNTDYKAAIYLLKECLPHLASRESPPPAQYYFLKIYLDLMRGRKEQAIEFIRDHFGHVVDDDLYPSRSLFKSSVLSTNFPVNRTFSTLDTQNNASNFYGI